MTGSAGQPAALAKGLRHYGVAAQSVIIGDNKFSYGADQKVDSAITDWVSVGRYLTGIVDEFDIFHLHMRPFFYWHPNKFYFPALLDLLVLKAAGKRICFHFRGSEVRRASLFRAENKFHYVDEDPERLFKKFREPSQDIYINYISAVADRVFVTDPELQSYVPGSVIIPRYFELPETFEARPLRDKNPVVLHAPSRRGVKGTEFVLSAVEQLRREGLKFEFRMVEGTSNAEILEAIADADILVDQLRIGWYGVLAVEGFALGRSVISYIRPDLVGAFGDRGMPVGNADPETLIGILREHIENPGLREANARAGREWFQKTHSTQAVIEPLLEHYQDIMHSPKPVDARGVQKFFEHQASLRDETSWLPSLPLSASMGLKKFKYLSETEGFDTAAKTLFRYLRRTIF
ncbi:glycosyltransferase [Microvirga solisilvae]|uniref:glycosyltransferase n=1 Tax=Microvirga solisilvae TaxID=2919498 RepID=UPI001FAFFBE6|nr:glycosyltransferase [Microvirga solisilvae]